MASAGSYEALLQRAKQWKAFDAWERSHRKELTLDERLSWYPSAFDFARALPNPILKDMGEKADRIRQLHARLERLGRRQP